MMKSLILRVLLVAIASLTVFLSPAEASNQDINQAAMLIAPMPNTHIQIYPKPDKTQSQTSYGQTGDRVTVLEQIGSNDGKTWNHIRFKDDSKSLLEGWVQSSYLSFQTSDQIQASTQSYSSQNQDREYSSHSKKYPKNSLQQQTNYPQKSQTDRVSNLKETVLGIKQKIAEIFQKNS